jgi:hypothetical protein
MIFCHLHKKSYRLRTDEKLEIARKMKALGRPLLEVAGLPPEAIEKI